MFFLSKYHKKQQIIQSNAVFYFWKIARTCGYNNVSLMTKPSYLQANLDYFVNTFCSQNNEGMIRITITAVNKNSLHVI